MPKRPSAHPTGAELDVLAVLWRRGPSTVRQVHEILQAARPAEAALTTTLKTMQIMTAKGMVACSGERPHRYTPTTPQAATQAGLLGDLVRRAFDGSLSKLLVRAVEDGGLSRDELAEVRRLIDRMRRHKGTDHERSA